MPQRFLVLSASVGAGHMRAAQAVELALRETAPGAHIRNVDVLTLTNAAFRKLYGQAYLDLVTAAPHLLGYVYDFMDKPRSPNSPAYKLRLAVQKLNLLKLKELLLSEPWDVVVNTHFLPAEIIADLRRHRKTKQKQITVTTDFDTHRLWVNQPCDAYTTATDEGRAYLAHWGVPAESIRVTGIPIHPVFAAEKPREACLKRLSLVGDRPIVLQLAGGFGVGPIGEIYRNVMTIEQPLEIVVVCGKNEKCKQSLSRMKVPERHRSRVIGFTNEIDEFMGAADLVISKPGGLTTSEVLARGAAFAIVNPIPGQESRNSDYLLENGAAVKINNVATLAHKIAPLLADQARLQQLKTNARRISRARAAYDVAKLAMEVAGAS